MLSLSPIRCLIAALLMVGLAGCRSHLVDVTLENQGPAMHVVEFDYPNASFGVNQLAGGGRYPYRIQVQGEGELSLDYEDAAGHKHSSHGPKVHKDDEGRILVRVDSGGAVHWLEEK